MAYIKGEPFVQQFADTSGNPLALGTLSFFLTGTSTATPVYSDSAGTSLGAVVTLDTNGAPKSSGGTPVDLYFDTAITYKIVLKNAAGSVIPPTIDPYFADVGAANTGYTPAGTGAVSTTVQLFLRSLFIPVTQFGATGDGTTDDLAAFNLAKTACASLKKALYIPRPATYYKLSGVFTIADDNFSMFGDGIKSCFVSHNVAAADVISITARSCRIRDIGVSGLTGGGHGIHINSGAVGQHDISDVWIGWVDGDGVRVTTGQSSTFTNVKCDQNSGYRPITLTSGTEGNINNGFNVLANASGNTNNQSFVNCVANAVAGAGSGDYNVRIGDSGGGAQPESCYWIGGLIQGGNHQIFISGKDNHFSCHIEPSVGVLPDPVVVFFGASSCTIDNCSVAGDILMDDSIGCGLNNVRGCGLYYAPGSSKGYWIGGQTANIITGPYGGKIRDFVGDLRIHNVVNASNENFGQGVPFIKPEAVTFATKFDDWYDTDGAGTLAPYGFSSYTNTTRYSATFLDTPYSARVIPASDLANCLRYTLPAEAVGKRVYVSAWVYNIATTGAGYIVGGTSSITVGQQSYQNDSWEHMQVYFTLTAGTSPYINFTGLTGVSILWDRIQITIEDVVTEPKRGHTDVTMAASTSGTITISSTYDRIWWEKNGPLVTFRGFLAVTSVSAPVGTFKIQGLPYTSSNQHATGQRPWQLVNVNINSLGLGAVVARIQPNTTEIEVYKYTAGNWADCAGDITSSADIYVEGSYLTDS